MEETIEVLSKQTVMGNEIMVYGTVENPLFMGKDVAEWVDYAKTSQGYYNVSKMLETIDEDEKLTVTIRDSEGHAHKQTFLTEDGLYEVLMQSRKPKAKKIKKEIKRILKELRVNGTVVSARMAVASPEEQALSFQKALETAMQHAFKIADSHYQPLIENLERERDEAIRRKGEISNEREAKVLGMYGSLVKKQKMLEIETEAKSEEIQKIMEKNRELMLELQNTIKALQYKEAELKDKCSHKKRNNDTEDLL